MPGSEGIRVKVEGQLVLFCSCAVQREVFPAREWGKGSLMSGECIMPSRCSMRGFWARFHTRSVSLLFYTCKCQTLMEWLVG